MKVQEMYSIVKNKTFGFYVLIEQNYGKKEVLNTVQKIEGDAPTTQELISHLEKLIKYLSEIK